MAIDRQILDSRRNGALSRGSRIAEGNARSSGNARRPGCSAGRSRAESSWEYRRTRLSSYRPRQWADRLNARFAAEAELGAGRVGKFGVIGRAILAPQPAGQRPQN
jgi:hypothetical protein